MRVMYVLCFIMTFSVHQIETRSAFASSNTHIAKEQTQAYRLLHERIEFSTSRSLPSDYVVEHLASAVLSQYHSLIVIEEMQPVVSWQVPELSSATMPLCDWLTLIRNSSRSMEWRVSDDAVYVVLYSDREFKNILDQPLRTDLTGIHTLQEWEGLVQRQYPQLRINFNNNGRNFSVYDDANNELKTRMIQVNAKKGISIRTYLTKLAYAYGSVFLIVDLEEQPLYHTFVIHPNFVNFMRPYPASL